MAALQKAIYAAIKMHRPALIKYTLYGGYEAVQLTEEPFEGTVAFIIGENFEFPTPLNSEAEKALAHVMWEALGYVPEEARNKPPKFLRPRGEPEEEPEPEPVKKKIKLKKRG